MKGLDYAEQHYPFYRQDTGVCAGGELRRVYGELDSDAYEPLCLHRDARWDVQSAERVWSDRRALVQRVGVPRACLDRRGAKDARRNRWADPLPAQPWSYVDRPVAQDPFRKWSPMLSIKNAKTPTLVIHSQRDYRLDVSEGFSTVYCAAAAECAEQDALLSR